MSPNLPNQLSLALRRLYGPPVRRSRDGGVVPVLRPPRTVPGPYGRQVPLLAAGMRCRDRRVRFDVAGRALFEPRFYDVRPIPDDATARGFIEQHHYSASYVAARVRVGLYEKRPHRPERLVGVAVFSTPQNNATVPAYAPGTAPGAGVELGRLVLLDAVPFNGESWFVARALAWLPREIARLQRERRAELAAGFAGKRRHRKRLPPPDVEVVLSFSDPMQRWSSDGSLVLAGHVGQVYQALNARHVGYSKAGYRYLNPAGRMVSPRAISKLRNGEQGQDYAEAALLALGAPPPRVDESAEAWIARSLAPETGVFRRVWHPGNIAYVWALGETRRERKAHTKRFGAELPYPRWERDAQPMRLVPEGKRWDVRAGAIVPDRQRQRPQAGGAL